jgi:hypothetical protein
MKTIFLIAILFFVFVPGAHAQLESNGSKLSGVEQSLADIKDDTKEMRTNSGQIQGSLAIIEGWGEPADYSKYFVLLIVFQAANTVLFVSILAMRFYPRRGHASPRGQEKGTVA